MITNETARLIYHHVPTKVGVPNRFAMPSPSIKKYTTPCMFLPYVSSGNLEYIMQNISQKIKTKIHPVYK